jgi:hypothetical protein
MFNTTAPRRSIAKWLHASSRRQAQTGQLRTPRVSRAVHSVVEQLEVRQLATVTPDPGATFATAFNVGDLNGAQTFSDAVGPADGSDFYKFSMPRDGMFFGRLRANNAPAEIDLIQEVTDPDGTVHEFLVDSRQANQDGADAGFASGDLPGRFLTAGNYFMVVTQRGADTSYLVRMTADYAGSSMSAARNIGSASDGTFQDFVGTFPTPSLNDPFDFYKVKMDAPGSLSATLTLDDARPELFQAHLQLIRDANGNGALDPGDVLQSTDPGAAGSLGLLVPQGTYFIRVINDLNFSNYHLRVQADYAGDLPESARITGALDNGKTFNDFISTTRDPIDDYRFSVNASRSLNVVFIEQNGGTSNLALYKDSNHDGIGQDSEVVLSTESRGFFNFVAAIDPGSYILRIKAATGSGAYEMFAIAPPDAAGNTLGTARNLGTINGLTHREDFVDRNDLVDFYKFTASAAGKVSAELTSEIGDADLALIRDANNNGRVDPGEILASSALTGNFADQFSRSITAGNYFLRVTAKSDEAPTKYLLSFHTDYAGDTPATARNVGTLAGTKTFDDWASGPFGGVISDKVDLYKVTLASTRTLAAKLTGSTPGQDLALQIFRDKNNNGKLDSNELIAATDHRDSPNEQITRSLAAGTYFVRVVGVNGETNYHLSLKD